MITSAQCRMARVALKWGVRELAKKAQVSTSTITRLEAGDRLQQRTSDAVRRALEAAGVEFTDGAKPGVHVRTAAPRSAERPFRTRRPSSPPAARAPTVEASGRSVTLAGATVAPRCHVCALVNSREDEEKILLPFTKEALDVGDRAIHLLDGRARGERLRRLRRGGIDVKRAERSGQLELWPWERAYLRHGDFDADAMIGILADIAGTKGRRGSRITRIWANMEWALREHIDSRRLLEYESRLNHVLPNHDLAVVCAYDLRRFSACDVADVVRAHPYVMLGGVFSHNPFYVPPEDFLPELDARGCASA